MPCSKAFAWCCALLCLSQTSTLMGQSVNDVSSSTASRFYQNFLAGVRMGMQARDLTLMTASLLLEQQDKWQGFALPPSELDLTLSSQLARTDGRRGLGAVSPLYYPRAVATYRLGAVLLLDAFTGKDYAPQTYFKFVRFHQALLYNTVVTHLAKRNLSRIRPDGSDAQSFFSGHTSTAFATSTFLYLELNDFINHAAANGDLPLLSRENWKRLSGATLFGWAAYVGYSRIHDRKHYPTDVVVGALSGALVSYLVYPRNPREHFASNSSWKFNAGLSPKGLQMSLQF